MEDNVFYKLGAARAAQDLAAWMQTDTGNPTAPVVTRKMAAEKAVERALQKLGKCKGKPHSAAGGITQGGSRAPVGKKSSFKRLKAKLKKRKG